MDRNETEIKADETAEREPTESLSPVSDLSANDESARTDELFRQGDELFAAGRFQRAVHVWTRILFVDRGNVRARDAIDRAKRAVAERQRRLDLECAEAGRELESGDVEKARSRVSALLSIDPSHAEAIHLQESIATLDRRSEPAKEMPANRPGESVISRGIVLRVPKGERARAASSGPSVSRAKMAAFLAVAFVVFAASATYLYQNWESIVNDASFHHPAVGASAAVAPPVMPVPDPGELRYFNAVRLYQKGRYREARNELSRIERDSPVNAEARSLILRIEERLLRSAPEAGESKTPDVGVGAGEGEVAR